MRTPTIRGRFMSNEGWIPPRKDPSNYDFTQKEIAKLYCENKEFRCAIDSNKYIFVDDKIVLKSTECIAVDKNGKLTTTNLDEDILSQYCLQFYYMRFRHVLYRLRPSTNRGKKARAFKPSTIRPILLEAAKASSIDEVDILSLKRVLAGENEKEDFSTILVSHMEDAEMTVESLAERTGLSVKTIQRMRNDLDARPKLESVVAVCLGLKLYPEESIELLSLAGYKLRKKSKEKAYSLLLNYLYEQDIRFCNNLLIELKIKPLTDLHD